MQIGFDAKRVFHNASGLGNYSRDAIRILSRYYPENRYLLYNPKAGKVDRFVLEENTIVRYPDSFLYKRFSSVWRRGPITKQLKKDHLDLFHGLSNELPAGIKSTGIKSVVTIHDLIFMRYPQWYSPPDRMIHKIKAKSAAHAANRIIAISEQTRDDLIHFFKIPAEKISVIYQGCHPAFKRPYSYEQKNNVRKKFNLPEKFLLNVGTIEERKNLLTVVKSMPYHNLPLVVIGKETKYAEKVKQYVYRKKLQDRIFFLKNVSMEELAVIYQLAYIFCYPSVFEGFGIPVIEALYSQTPVITSKGSCFPEAGGPSSFYIDSYDEKMLAEKINKLLNDKALYQNISRESFKFVQKFNDDKIASQIIKLYSEVL